MVLRTILESTIQWDRIQFTNASAQVLLLLGVSVLIILILMIIIIIIDEGEVILIGKEVHGLIFQKVIIDTKVRIGVSTDVLP